MEQNKDLSGMKSVTAKETSEAGQQMPGVSTVEKPVVDKEQSAPSAEDKTVILSEADKSIAAVSSGAEDKAEEKTETDDDGDEVVFAENSALEHLKTMNDTYGKGKYGVGSDNSSGGESAIFADPVKKTERQRIPVQKDKKPKAKKKFPVIPVISVAAVMCLCVAGAVLLINSNNSNQAVQTAASEVSKASASKNESVTMTSEAEKEKAEVVDTSEVHIEVSDIDTSNILFGQNVTVEGVNLAGLSLTQAHDAMQEKLLSLRDSISIKIACSGKTVSLTEDDFEFDSNLSEVLLQAYHYSRGEIDNPTVAKTISNGVADFKIKTAINKDSVQNAVNKVADTFDIKPVNARVVKFEPDKADKFTFADGKNGFLVDKKEITSRVESILALNSKNGSFTVTAKETPFTIKLKDIKANTRLIASHYTTAANRYESNMNMELAIRAASGTIVEPGETFSFNEMTGDTTHGNEHRYPNGVTGSYLKSTAIVKGKYEDQYGGGICQASTTLYICAMKANMEPVERHAHAYPSTYAERGLDATVDYGTLDMKFKNNGDYPIYIATYVYDYNGDGYDELLVEMYGAVSREYDEIVPIGWVTSVGNETFNATGAKVFFKNGKEVKREKLITDYYHYKYDTYYSASALIPNDPENGPSASPTGRAPSIYSPNGCGSNGPIEYGTADEYLKKAGL